MMQIERRDKVVKAIVPLTPSKSITNRALIIRALTDKKFSIKNSALATDSVILGQILETLPAEINVNDAGTAFRFLTAYLCIQDGSYILTGSNRMKERPVGALVKALRDLGADITYQEKENYPPLKITGKILRGGEVQIDGSESSQFASALLMIGPKLPGGLTINMRGKKNSWPYIELTLSIMSYFGVQAQMKGDIILIPHKEYTATDFVVENDWSAASFWYEVAALSDEAEITLKGLRKDSPQGDKKIIEIMEQFGVQTEVSGQDVILRKNTQSKIPSSFEYDFSFYPDLVMPVAFTCAALNISAVFTGVKNLKIKESNRLSSLKEEMEKAGVKVEINEDSLVIKPGNGNISNPVFHSHNDHRLAMSIAPLALRGPIVIDNPLAVNKSYPGFWDQLTQAGFSCMTK